jgi:hypothetical protein
MIDKRDAGDFWVVEIGDQAHHPAERLADGVESGLVAIRTALAIAGNRTMNESGITLRQFVIIQSSIGCVLLDENFPERYPPLPAISEEFREPSFLAG